MKNIMKKFFRLLGYDLIEYSKDPYKRASLIDCRNLAPGSRKLMKMLEVNQIDLVYDIGANVGNWGTALYDSGYEGRLISFEPLSSAYKELVCKSKNNPNWQVYDRCAIGDYSGEKELNISANMESSSMLPMLNSHLEAAPNSKYVGIETVKVFRLDEVEVNYFKEAKNVFVKIDAQGYENKILDGANAILDRIKGVQMELSLIPLYQGETLFEDMVLRMKESGFELYSLSEGFWDFRNGRTLQVNCVFFKNLSHN